MSTHDVAAAATPRTAASSFRRFGPALAVVTGFAGCCALAVALGFDHVSDDDYARVTIAETFAHTPRLDPSGTSWLPFPFWALGTGLAVLGRSLAAARIVSITLASLAALLPYAALRATGVTRGRALAALTFALLAPWSVWLGASTVPESFTASATAAAAVALGSARAPVRAQLGFALALFAACLSRYEPWPVAAVLGLLVARRAWQGRSAALAGATALAVAGPLAWMLWNRHAHGDALHFFVRVSRFKRAIGEGATDPVAALLLYPRLLLTMRIDAVLALVLAAFAVSGSPARAELRARWTGPLACAAAQLVFLAYGNLRDGAPAHHAERPLLAVTVVLALCAVDVLGATFVTAGMQGRRLRAAAVSAVCAAWGVVGARGFRDVPGKADFEDRRPQIARGLALRAEGVRGVTLTPCAYEHFALVAAYGAPEDVTARPSANTPVTASCPVVEPR